MRILHRAFSKIQEGFVYGYYYEDNKTALIIDENNIRYVVDKKTLSVFTGKYDHLSVKLFTNDIVRVEGENDEFIIKWDNDMASFILFGPKYSITFDEHQLEFVEVAPYESD